MKRKYVPCLGLAFFEEFEMKRLAKYAKKGWILEKFSFTNYVLRKAEPIDLIYSLDYQSDTSHDYFKLFEEAGWKYLCSAGSDLHIFCAPPGTNSIYTDRATYQDKYQREQSEMKKVALPSLFIFLLLIASLVGCNIYSVPVFIEISALILTLLVYILLVFTGMPYLAYLYKSRKINKKNNGF